MELNVMNASQDTCEMTKDIAKNALINAKAVMEQYSNAQNALMGTMKLDGMQIVILSAKNVLVTVRHAMNL